MSDTAPYPMTPAATLVLFRQTTGDWPELLMIERGGGMAFAAGALVFPGGRIDPGDHVVAADPSLVGAGALLDPEDGVARVAAIRETIEEVGVAVGMAGGDVNAVRAALADGADFGDLLRRSGLILDLEQLTPFARWRPNMRETRNFDTRFYLAAAPDGAVAEADGGESVHAAWMTAQEVLAEVDAGRRHAIFPTRRNLERLSRFASIEEARADAALYPLRPITPWIEDRDGEPWLCIPDDQGYHCTRERVATARRG